MSMNFVSTVATAAVLGVLSSGAHAASERLVIFAFDISDSAPVATDRNIARQAGKTVRAITAALRPDDRVKLRSLGFAGAVETQIDVNVTLGRKVRSRADRIAPVLGRLVASFPERAERGEIEVQTRTNIIGFVEALAPSLDCRNVDTRIVIFTDGIEWSTQVKGQDLVDGKADLPPPSGPILEGCVVEMRGLGQVAAKYQTDSRWFPRLRTQWTRFFEAAGAARFSAYAAFE